jgi:hypothetical protein
MPYVRLPIRVALCCFSLAIASCARPPLPPQTSHAGTPKPVAKADWFHRELALARRARADHRPSQDLIGAQRAYYAIMVPVCQSVEKSGPERYLSRCRTIIANARLPKISPSSYPACAESDDSKETPAQVTACSD